MARIDSLILVMLGIAQMLIGNSVTLEFIGVLLQGTGGGTIVMAIYFLIFLSKGFGSMYGTGKLFQLFVALQSDGTIDMDDAIGSVGTIYLRIPEGGVGQIQVESGSAMRTYNAKTEDGQGMATGEFAEVIDVISSTLIVKRK